MLVPPLLVLHDTSVSTPSISLLVQYVASTARKERRGSNIIHFALFKCNFQEKKTENKREKEEQTGQRLLDANGRKRILFLFFWLNKNCWQSGSKTGRRIMFPNLHIRLSESSSLPLQDLLPYPCHQWREQSTLCEETPHSVKCTLIHRKLKSWTASGLHSMYTLVGWVKASTFNQQRLATAQLACSKDTSVTSMSGINGF